MLKRNLLLATIIYFGLKKRLWFVYFNRSSWGLKIGFLLPLSLLEQWMPFNYVAQVISAWLFLLFTFYFGVAFGWARLHIFKLYLCDSFVVLWSIAHLVWGLSSYEVSLESSDLIFVFTDQGCRHVFHTGIETELFNDLVNLVAVNLSGFAILLHHIPFTHIFNRLHHRIQLFQPLLALYDFSKRVVVFRSLHRFDLESLGSLRLQKRFKLDGWSIHRLILHSVLFNFDVE